MFGHAKEKLFVLYGIVLLLVFSVSVAPTAVIVNAQQVPDKDCAFTPTLAKCKPDQKGKCPSGFSLNVKSECIPNKCPKGFVRHDNDETGKCFPIGKSGSATFKITVLDNFTEAKTKKVAGFDYISALTENQKQLSKFYSAKLHNATTTQINEIVYKKNIFACIATALKPHINTEFVEQSFRDTLGTCDNSITDMLINHSLGSNQTMINMARDYLKSRGIQ